VPTGTILTGLVSIDGVPVQLCVHDCDNVLPTKGQAPQCERADGHPDDKWGHICQDCVKKLASSL
jgi:hypothetical protein